MTREEIRALRDLVQRQERDLIEYARFVEWLCGPFVDNGKEVREALSIKDRPMYDLLERLAKLPPVRLPPKDKDEE